MTADRWLPAEGSSAAALAAGTTLGPYRIEALIGTGGMGEVYRARDARLGRGVAIKVLPEVARGDVERRQRLEREARAISSLSHPHICTLYDIGEHEGLTYLVMELLEGETLAARLERGPLEIDEALRYATEVAQALDRAHRQDIIHRDLKPRNVMLTKDGAKLLDFGVAKLGAQSASLIAETSTHAAGGTVEGVVLGTLPYMAPEQVEGREADARTDLFAFGAVLYEMLTGRQAFQGDSQARLISAILRDDPPPVGERQPHAPASLDRIVSTCLAKQPDERWQTAADLARELEWVLDQRRTPQERKSAFVRAAGAHRKTWIAAAAAVIVVTIGATTSWRFLSDGTARGAPPGPAAVVAVLPHANPAGEPIAEQLGLGITSLIARNLRSAGAVKVVGGEGTASYATARTDLDPLRRDVGANYVIDLTVRRAAPSVDLLVRLRRPGSGVPVWEQAMTGDAVEVQQQLLQQLTDALRREGIRFPSGAAAAVLRRLPTTHGEAFLAYVQARALLEYKDVAGNPRRAVDLLEGAIAKDGHFALAHAALADALNAQFGAEREPELLERAASEARTALQIDPEESAAHTAFAAVEFALGRRDVAVNSLLRAIDLKPDNDEAYRLLGQILAEQDKVEEAIAPLRTAIRLRPASFNHHYSLGFALFQASRFSDAADAYGAAAAIRPENARAYQMLGATHQAIGQTDRAIGYYEHAIRLGASATAHANLALAYFTAGEFMRSRDAYILAIERDPTKASLHRDLGDVYLRLNQRADARRSYQRAIALARAALSVRRGDPFSIVLIGLCEANLGRRAEAERHAAEAIALAPNSRDVLFRSAKVFALTRNRDAALKALRGAIERGYDAGVARRDPELASLRPLPEFERVLSAKPGTGR
jgi:tetratricopeptide (TPR) repeat protein